MKIIEHGVQPTEPTEAEWVGRVLKCACGCRFELEKGDKVTTIFERSPNGRRDICVVCPDCDANVYLDLRQGAMHFFGASGITDRWLIGKG
jgi:hypothetical protein